MFLQPSDVSQISFLVKKKKLAECRTVYSETFRIFLYNPCQISPSLEIKGIEGREGARELFKREGKKALMFFG